MASDLDKDTAAAHAMFRSFDGMEGVPEFVPPPQKRTLLDTAREQHGNDPLLWLPVLLREVQDRKTRNSRRAT